MNVANKNPSLFNDDIIDKESLYAAEARSRVREDRKKGLKMSQTEYDLKSVRSGSQRAGDADFQNQSIASMRSQPYVPHSIKDRKANRRSGASEMLESGRGDFY